MKKTMLICIFTFILSCSFFYKSFAQEETSIVAYYPSPNASFTQLEARHLAIGYPAGSARFYDNYLSVQTVLGAGTDTIAIGGATRPEIIIRSATNILSIRNLTTGTPPVVVAENIVCLKKTTATGPLSCPAEYYLPLENITIGVTAYLCCPYK